MKYRIAEFIYHIIRNSIFAGLLFSGLSYSIKIPETEQTTDEPVLYPDYPDVTIPVNIAPLNFKLVNPAPAILQLQSKNNTWQLENKKGRFLFPEKKWKSILLSSAGDTLKATIYSKQPDGWKSYPTFNIYVSTDPVDETLVYRRLAPGYRMWNEMGIYQRSLTGFKEQILLENRQTNNNCMNCHCFNRQQPDDMVFHQRSMHGGTYRLKNGKIEQLPVNENSLQVTSLVYPAWHPDGKWMAFSTNDTKQDFHHADPNRIEVFDHSSSIVLYDMDNGTITSSAILNDSSRLNTYPAFSPDGKSLYFCSAETKPLPDQYRDIKYHLLRLDFDPESGTFASFTDTIYQASESGGSAKFPRISPDGRFLMYTLSEYGNFSIWHRDADLCLYDLEKQNLLPLDQVNSPDTESYHTWSSNNRWFVFSSRRDDGLYTRPYLCYLDENGRTGKPFLLPQEDPDYYTFSLFSFNIPELVKHEIVADNYELMQFTRNK